MNSKYKVGKAVEILKSKGMNLTAAQITYIEKLNGSERLPNDDSIIVKQERDNEMIKYIDTLRTIQIND